LKTGFVTFLKNKAGNGWQAAENYPLLALFYPIKDYSFFA
jgi:hypothetical protein